VDDTTALIAGAVGFAAIAALGYGAYRLFSWLEEPEKPALKQPVPSLTAPPLTEAPPSITIDPYDVLGMEITLTSNEIDIGELYKEYPKDITDAVGRGLSEECPDGLRIVYNISPGSLIVKFTAYFKDAWQKGKRAVSNTLKSVKINISKMVERIIYYIKSFASKIGKPIVAHGKALITYIKEVGSIATAIDAICKILGIECNLSDLEGAFT
jgi:hypothetical protein